MNSNNIAMEPTTFITMRQTVPDPPRPTVIETAISTVQLGLMRAFASDGSVMGVFEAQSDTYVPITSTLFTYLTVLQPNIIPTPTGLPLPLLTAAPVRPTLTVDFPFIWDTPGVFTLETAVSLPSSTVTIELVLPSITAFATREIIVSQAVPSVLMVPEWPQAPKKSLEGVPSIIVGSLFGALIVFAGLFWVLWRMRKDRKWKQNHRQLVTMYGPEEAPPRREQTPPRVVSTTTGTIVSGDLEAGNQQMDPAVRQSVAGHAGEERFGGGVMRRTGTAETANSADRYGESLRRQGLSRFHPSARSSDAGEFAQRFGSPGPSFYDDINWRPVTAGESAIAYLNGNSTPTHRRESAASDISNVMRPFQDGSFYRGPTQRDTDFVPENPNLFRAPSPMPELKPPHRNSTHVHLQQAFDNVRGWEFPFSTVKGSIENAALWVGGLGNKFRRSFSGAPSTREQFKVEDAQMAKDNDLRMDIELKALNEARNQAMAQLETAKSPKAVPNTTAPSEEDPDSPFRDSNPDWMAFRRKHWRYDRNPLPPLDPGAPEIAADPLDTAPSPSPRLSMPAFPQPDTPSLNNSPQGSQSDGIVIHSTSDDRMLGAQRPLSDLRDSSAEPDHYSVGGEWRCMSGLSKEGWWDGNDDAFVRRISEGSMHSLDLAEQEEIQKRLEMLVEMDAQEAAAAAAAAEADKAGKAEKDEARASRAETGASGSSDADLATQFETLCPPHLEGTFTDENATETTDKNGKNDGDGMRTLT